jgi:hypothetical protein
VLKASPIQDKKEQEELCKLCGVVYKPNLFAYSQKENDSPIAISQFDINENGGIIYDLKMKDGLPDDIEALFILGRAVLNFLDLTGNNKCIFNVKDEHDKKMATMLRFKETAGVWELYLEGIFEGSCHK